MQVADIEHCPCELETVSTAPGKGLQHLPLTGAMAEGERHSQYSAAAPNLHWAADYTVTYQADRCLVLQDTETGHQVNPATHFSVQKRLPIGHTLMTTLCCRGSSPAPAPALAALLCALRTACWHTPSWYTPDNTLLKALPVYDPAAIHLVITSLVLSISFTSLLHTAQHDAWSGS